MYNGRLILDDTGDFVDDYAVDRKLRNDLSALFLVTVAPPEIASLELLPVHIDDMQVNLAKGPEREWIVQRIKSLRRSSEQRSLPDTEGGQHTGRSTVIRRVSANGYQSIHSDRD